MLQDKTLLSILPESSTSIHTYIHTCIHTESTYTIDQRTLHSHFVKIDNTNPQGKTRRTVLYEGEERSNPRPIPILASEGEPRGE